MIYIWRIPNNYPNKKIGEYDRERSPNRFKLMDGKVLNENIGVAYFEFECSLSDLASYDELPNNADLPLINKRLRNLLDEIAEDDVQYFDAIIECSDGKSDEYKIVNITNTVKAIDHNQSKYHFILDSNSIGGFKKLAHLPTALEKHEIARDEEYTPHILVSKKLRDAFREHHITGVELITDEEFNQMSF